MSPRKRSTRVSYVDPSSESEDDNQTGSGNYKKSKYFTTTTAKESSPGTDGAAQDSDEESIVKSEDLESSVEEEEDGEEASVESDESSESSVHGSKRAGNVKGARRASSTAKRNVPNNKKPKLKDENSHGIEVDNVESGDEQGEVFIAKLPALPAGDVDYKADTIHPNTLDFLRQLRHHNERDWFQQRELQYQATKSDFDSFVLALAKTIVKIDDTIPELPVKDLTFRIYRDIRFSNDRTPYKTFLAAYFSRSGRKGPWAGYYFSLEPGGKTLLACGLWQPPAHDLALVRESIDSDIESWEAVIEDPAFKQFFGGREGLLKTEDRLKTCPKSYPKDHKNIDLLRLKSFNIRMNLNDEEVLQEGFMDILSLVIAQMYPFVTLLNNVIRPEDSEED